MIFNIRKLFLRCVVLFQFFYVSHAFCDAKRGDLYIEPTQNVLGIDFFQGLIQESDRDDATFGAVLDEFNQHTPSFYRIQFKYPIKTEQVQKFIEALQIKSQQAHRFIPRMKKAEFIETRPLGFIRRLDLDGNGFTVQDRILVDNGLPRILFIQEWFIDSEGNKRPGNFAAVNAVIQENGCWYFFGEYLYAMEPPEEAVNGMMETFWETYQNMLLFIRNEDVDEIFQSLKSS